MADTRNCEFRFLGTILRENRRLYFLLDVTQQDNENHTRH